MTNDERLTLGKVLTEIGALRQEFAVHFDRVENHLTSQDERLRSVEILTAKQQAADDVRLEDIAESRISKRWVVTTIVTAMGAMIAATSIIVTILLRIIPTH